MERELPIKIAITRIVNMLDNLKIESEVLDVLKKARNLLYVCQHCGNETDSYGRCIEAQLHSSPDKRNSI